MQEKFQQLLQEEHLTAGKLAEILEVQPAVISHMLSGRNKPSFPLIQKILRRFPHLNPYWLLLDDSKMYNDGYTSQDNTQKHSTLNQNILSQTASDNEKNTEQADATSTPRESNISEFMPVGTEIFNSRDISHSPASKPSDTLPATSNGTAKLERIIAIYSDGTFQDYLKR